MLPIFLCNLILSFFPPTRFFSFKRFIVKFFDITIGDNSCITSGLKIYGRGYVSIGQNVWCGHNLHFYLARGSKVQIGNNCDIAPEVVFHTGSHIIGEKTRRAGKGYGENIEIGDGVWIGTRVTVLNGCKVGHGSVVGAGTLLLGKYYPPNSMIYGVPGKVIHVLR